MNQALPFTPAPAAEQLGSAAFRQRYKLRLAYMAGAMASGIAGETLVETLSRAGCLASFGAAGLSLARVSAAITQLRQSLPGQPLCFNLIHTPDDPAMEHSLVELYLAAGIEVIEASAFMALTSAIVLYRARGAHFDATGHAVARQRIIAKVSRREVAEPFLRPAPEAMLTALLNQGALTATEAAAARLLPLADDITIEADSGGHTDRQSLVCALPAMMLLRARVARDFPPAASVGLGAAGGISTPSAIRAAFAMGADYVVTGSINQACIESGSSSAVRRLLAGADLADVAMAPAADMFELGVQVQVLKRGTLFASRATSLWALYRTYPSLDALPQTERDRLERDLYKQPLAAVQAQTLAFWQERNPTMAERAQREPKVMMGLVFRWYLGQSSRWAIEGVPERAMDYQIWCGPAMGAFNQWAADTVFASFEARRVAEVADALMTAAAYPAAASNAVAMIRSAPPAIVVRQPVSSTSTIVKGMHTDTTDAESIRDWLMEQVAAQLDVSADDIDPRRTFESYALDSARAMLILTRLEARLSLKLSPTLIWNYPTIEKLAERLVQMSQARALALEPA
ncbi:PfaD family polyunsaturated fatty acid/polyketide biosynthesis protein [Chitinimonas sp. BJB300]|uniref:PfaD family polyunsaturated fatty acid/polyketide biosynthesis protein n=1 Tax=Chitinimonas sp. BJB300 TaxID=1559339 RepID=UPI000C0EBC98|nr:PfaD family polyunsaturated fatty acid/polyketide biosynthesis protein [Chitinimonas sp. BJB300]PHV12100.1 2-nitropropane dioxygenase [Chitinimonas sp. BJB300]TSJ87509.1 PfaD family polyunsaturated fatty acid/polyketide biosynthesis protein [Chitinimonas sp. BJB300]